MLDERLKTKLRLYISGSQGVSPDEIEVEYGLNFITESELTNIFNEFIDENANEYVEDYLIGEDDNDYDRALGDAIADSGNFYIYIGDEDEPSFEFDGCFIEEIAYLD